MAFISTNKQLVSAIRELTAYQWVTEEICKNLTKKEFSFIAWAVSQYGMEIKIRNILERAARVDNQQQKNKIAHEDCGLAYAGVNDEGQAEYIGEDKQWNFYNKLKVGEDLILEKSLNKIYELNEEKDRLAEISQLVDIKEHNVYSDIINYL